MRREAQHTDVGAYALGLLEDRDRRLFETHLTHCDSCVAELTGFSAMRELFAGVEPVALEPAAVEAAAVRPVRAHDDHDDAVGNVVNLIRRRQTAERRRHRGAALLGTAAGVALLAAGTALGTSLDGAAGVVPGHRHGSPAQDLLDRGERRSAMDPVTLVAGTVAMETTGWGTEVALDLSNVRGPLVCRLVAVTRSGARRVVTDWSVPRPGYGVPGSPKHLLVHGGTARTRADITRFEIRIEGGDRLLTILV